jgi:hypothetical protein
VSFCVFLNRRRSTIDSHEVAILHLLPIYKEKRSDRIRLDPPNDSHRHILSYSPDELERALTVSATIPGIAAERSALARWEQAHLRVITPTGRGGDGDFTIFYLPPTPPEIIQEFKEKFVNFSNERHVEPIFYKKIMLFELRNLTAARMIRVTAHPDPRIDINSIPDESWLIIDEYGNIEVEPPIGKTIKDLPDYSLLKPLYQKLDASLLYRYKHLFALDIAQ